MKTLTLLFAVSLFAVGCGTEMETSSADGGAAQVAESAASAPSTPGTCQPSGVWQKWGTCGVSTQWSQTMFEGHFTNDCNPNPSNVLGKLDPVDYQGTPAAACRPPPGTYPALCYIAGQPDGRTQCQVSVSADGTVTLTSHTPAAFSSVYPFFRL